MKKDKERKLAIEGGEPVRKQLLPYGRQLLEDDDREAVMKVLNSDWITRGPCVQAFEDQVAEWADMPYAVAFSSGTAALHAAMSALNIQDGKTVVVPPLTFAATANSVLYCHGQVKFIDVLRDTMNIDPERLSAFSKASVVVAVDFAGNPCDYDVLQQWKRRSSFHLVADAAHSFGASYKGKRVGCLADLTVLSFHPVKSITTAEGGMLLTWDKALSDFLRCFRDHGIQRSSEPGFYELRFLGFNYHITDLQCALGLSQLTKLKRFIRRRTEIAEMYHQFFGKISCVEIPRLTAGAQSAWHLYPIRLYLEKLTVDRDTFLKALIAENIGANVHYIPVHWHSLYQKQGFQRGLCPVAETQYLREISLPIFPGMRDEDVQDVCRAVEKVCLAYGCQTK